MLNITDKSKCSGCHSCAVTCPKQCIKMVRDSEGFLYPQIDADRCINCGLCEKKCPVLNPVENSKSEKDIQAYAAYTKNEQIRLSSSSGGMFTEIAECVIRQGGVVCGAAFDDEFQVHHIFVDNVDDLEKLRGSKYVQSTVGDTYKKAEEYLEAGRLLLFSGTPCQIGGLYSYLKKEYYNLITQDIICHGVPSPSVWEKYIKFREKNAASKTRRMFFRHKKNGWKMYSVRFEFTNSTEYIQIYNADLYMRGFLADLCLRPSCYDCSFKNKIRQSDIMLADFWGIQNILPEMDDDKGTSLVFVNSAKGRELWNGIEKNIVYQKIDADVAIQYNPAMVRSVAHPPKRDKFMTNITEDNFDVLLNELQKVTFSTRLKRKIKRTIKAVLNK